MFAADPASLKLSELTECAYRLGLAFGAEAEQAETPERRVEYFQLFDRCFFGVRVAIALQLRLQRAPAGQDALSARGDPSERDQAEREAADHDGLDRYTERDRERDLEPASLPILLRTLGGVAADAAALPGPEPAELPTLRELLAQVTSQPTATPSPRAGGASLRARLAGSATTQALTLPPPKGSGPELRIALPTRQATGPPRR